jgi:hypothetical protein
MAANSPTRPTVIGAPRHDTSGMNCAVGPVRSVCSKVDRASRRRLRRVMPPLRKVASTAKKGCRSGCQGSHVYGRHMQFWQYQRSPCLYRQIEYSFVMKVSILAYDGCMGAEVFGFADILLVANRISAFRRPSDPSP